MMSQRAKFSSFLWPSSILLCKCTIVALSSYLLMDNYIKVIFLSTFPLSWLTIKEFYFITS